MTIRHMRIFQEVVHCNSMSTAAKNLYIAQPTVSQTIGEIETLYNVKLFERLSKKLYITPAGELLLEYANRILALHNEMDNLLKSNQVRQIHLGATLTVGTCIFSDIIASYKRIQPDIQTRVLVENTSEIEKHLLESKLDIALVEGRVSSSDIIFEPVIKDTLVLVSSAVHPFANRASVKMADLHGEPFIMREEGSGTRDFFEQRMQEKGYGIKCVWVCHNTDAIKNAVIANHGLTVISRRLVQNEIDSGLICACEIEDYSDKRTFALAYHKNKFLFPYYEDFMNLCRNFDAPDNLGDLV